MHVLTDLPHRFWPESELPEGVKVWPKFLNLKTAAFAKVYTKQVNPTLKALGFKCKAMRGRGQVDDFITLSWFVGDKYGGSGYLAFAAHPLWLPSRNDDLIAADAMDFQHVVFRRQMRLFEHRIQHYGDRFDLGKDEAEAIETCALLRQCIAEQAAPFLANLPVALTELRSVAPAEFEARMPELTVRHDLRVTGSSFMIFENDRIELALLLGRLALHDGRLADAGSWAEIGLGLLGGLARHPYPRHRFAILFEKLARADLELGFTAADRAEHNRRMAS